MSRRSDFRIALVALVSVAGASLVLTPTGGAVFSGCGPYDAPDVFPEGTGHDHSANTQHAFASAIDLVGHTDPGPAVASPIPRVGIRADLDAVGADSSGAEFGEVDVLNGYAVQAVISAPSGIVIYDVSDPANPVAVGRWNANAGGYATDVKWSGDGNSVYVSWQEGGASVDGIHVLDATDKTHPTEVSKSFVGNSVGVHMMAVEHVALSVDIIYGFTAYGGGTLVYASTLLTATAGLPTAVHRLALLATWSKSDAPHDGWLYDDPLANKTLLYMADGTNGIAIADVSNPLQPTTVGRWQGAGAPYAFYSHTIRAEVKDGHRWVFISPEGGAFGLGTNVPSCVFVFDATDLAHIALVGGWSAPGSHLAGTFFFSTHNIQLVGDRVYLAHYHGGVWVLDARDPAHLATLGYYEPASHTTTAGGRFGLAIEHAIPGVWDVTVNRGRIYASDISGGLYVLHYAGDTVGTGGPTSVG
ncbi:MAG: LVIVD repeat-containing protein [Thermoplasmatota archaeon]